jgi:hypothetical protein
VGMTYTLLNPTINVVNLYSGKEMMIEHNMREDRFYQILKFNYHTTDSIDEEYVRHLIEKKLNNRGIIHEHRGQKYKVRISGKNIRISQGGNPMVDLRMQNEKIEMEKPEGIYRQQTREKQYNSSEYIDEVLLSDKRIDVVGLSDGGYVKIEHMINGENSYRTDDISIQDYDMPLYSDKWVRETFDKYIRGRGYSPTILPNEDVTGLYVYPSNSTLKGRIELDVDWERDDSSGVTLEL